jgi:hypothetical protein
VLFSSSFPHSFIFFFYSCNLCSIILSPRSVLLHFNKFTFTIVKNPTKVMRTQTIIKTKRKATTLPPLHGRPLAAQRGRPRLQQLSTKQTTTATVICPRFCPASKQETQGRNRTENEHASSKHATSPATVREPCTKICP